MMSSYTIECDGYEFDISAYFRASVLVGDDAPLDDKAYLKALRKIQKILPYLTALHVFNSLGEQGGMRNVLLVIEAHEKKIFPVDPETYQEAVSILNGNPRRRKTPATKNPKPAVPGYVYLIKSPSGHYKIGRTVNPNDRLRMFGVQLPFEVEIIALIKSDDHKRLEASLHQTYNDKRVNGEWFALSPEDVDYVKSLAV